MSMKYEDYECLVFLMSVCSRIGLGCSVLSIYLVFWPAGPATYYIVHTHLEIMIFAVERRALIFLKTIYDTRVLLYLYVCMYIYVCKHYY